MNLAVNARDAMPNGGSLVIAAKLREIAEDELVGLEAGSYVCLAVRDEGDGMDEETLANAITPFFTTKGVGKGTGLGLPMVQGLMAQSGGKLILKSCRGEGTTAELWLPVAAETRKRKRRAGKGSRVRGRRFVQHSGRGRRCTGPDEHGIHAGRSRPYRPAGPFRGRGAQAARSQ